MPYRTILLLILVLLSAPPLTAGTARKQQMEKKALQDFERIEQKDRSVWRKRFRDSAEAGFLVLANGQVLFGSIHSRDGAQTVRFRMEDGSSIRTVTLDETMDRPFPELKKLAAQSRIDIALKDAAVRMENGEFALASARLEQAVKTLAEAGEAAKEDLSREIADLQAKLNRILKEKRQTLYQGRAFPDEELKRHLDAGHILFSGKVWIRPEQLCKSCHGKGAFPCETCREQGTLLEDCELCEGKGSLPCRHCQGSGKKQCPDCEGKGLFQRVCSRCKGSRTITRSQVALNIDRNKMPIVMKNQVTCPSCRGNGGSPLACGKCRGTGSLDCPLRTECPDCEGKGAQIATCPDCHGTKAVNCPDCLGGGYTGTPEE